MRFTLSAVSVLCVLACIMTAGAVASESGEFVEWALQQGRACDSSWNSFVKSQPDGLSVAGANVRGLTARSSFRTETGLYANGKGFIHKANLPFLPFSTRERGGPARGVTKLDSPASARLNVPHTRRRPFNSRTEMVSFRRRRSSSTRLSVTSSHRISRISRTRRSASGSFTRTIRTR
jgi:hypothetical protein